MTFKNKLINDKMKIGIIIAVECEIPKIFNILKFKEKKLFRNYRFSNDFEILLCISGPGEKNAKEKTDLLLKNFEVNYILNSGFSGAAYNEAKIGDLIVANQIKQDQNTLELDSDLIKLTKSIINSDGQSCKVGTVQVFDQFVHSKIGLSKDVLAVDMESYHIAKTALKYGKKTIVIRSISDILSERDPLFFPGISMRYKFIKGLKTAVKGLDSFYEKFLDYYKS